MSAARRWIQRGLPVVVSAAALIWVFREIDAAAVADALSWRVAALLLPALLAYGAGTLLLEAISLRLLVPSELLGRWTAARIKCASYLLSIVHYALGVGALTVLLRRRARVRLSEAASATMMISATDLLMVLLLGGVSGALWGIEQSTLLIGLLALAGIAFFGGLTLLRMPASLGPLDRIRALSVFDALRTVPLSTLSRLFAARFAFVSCFVGVCAVVFLAFEVPVPLARLVAGVLIVAAVAALPIAVAGLGVGQLAFVALFRDIAAEETLLAMSLVLSASLIALRAAMGLVFARELTREAWSESEVAAREDAVA